MNSFRECGRQLHSCPKDVLMWYIYSVEYYSDLNKNKGILPSLTTWIDVEVVMLTEISESQMYQPLEPVNMSHSTVREALQM